MEQQDILRTELETFAKHKAELLSESLGKYVLIHNEEIVGTYTSETDAIAEGYKQFGNVPLFVKLISQVDTAASFVNNNLGI